MRTDRRLLAHAASLWRANSLALLGAAVCVAALAAAWTLAFVGIASDRAGALEEIERNNGNLVGVLEEQTRRTIKSVDRTVLFVRRDFLQRGRDLDLADMVATGDIEVRNRNDGDPASAIVQIRVLDARGDPLLFARPVEKVNVADRRYFAVHRDVARGDRCYVSGPVVSPTTGIASIQVSRRILDSRGGFAGVVTASVDVAYFTALYEHARFGPRDIVSLVSLEGETIARRVGTVTSFGQDLRGSELFTRQKVAANGSYTGSGYLDGVTRHFSYRTLPDMGLLVTVGSSLDDAMAPAAARRRIYVVSTGIASALLLVVLALLASAARRQNQFVAELTMRERRFRRLFENSHDAIVAVDVASDGSLHVTESNPAATELGGIDAEGIFGSAHAEDSSANEASLAASIRKCAARGERVRFEGAVRSPRGELFLAATIAPLWRTEAYQNTSSTGAKVGVVVMAQNITARKQAEDAERKSQRHLRHLIDGLSPSMFVGLLTPQGILVEVNQAPLAAAGLMPQDVLGKAFEDTHWWSHSPQAQRQLREAIGRAAQGESSQFELRTQGVKGDLIDIDFCLTPLRDETGEVIFLIPSASVITERKRAESALGESELEFRTLAEAMPQIVWVTRADGWSTYFSQQWMDYTGLTLEESLGHGWNKPFHPDDKQRAWDAWQHATATEDLYSIESRLCRADGEYRWWLVRGVPSLDAAGHVVKWYGTCTDIHDLKVAELEVSRANRELQRQKTELQVLFDLVPAMIWFKDTKNNILRTNAVAAKAIGRTVKEMEGKSSLDLYPELAAQVHAEDLEVIRSGVPMLGIVQTVADGKGGEVWIQRDKVPYRDEEGKVIGIVSMAQDITERKRDQDTLHALNTDLEARVRSRTVDLNLAREEAEDANRAKSAFLATMSHEIRTPMNGVIGMIEVLQHTGLDGHQVEMVDLIRDSAFALLQIIEDILDFSKIEAGRLAVENEPMQLARTVEQVCGMLDHLAQVGGVRLTMFIDPALPAIVVGDEGRLRQVLVNLAGNAIKFSGGRDRPGHVSVRAVQVAREPGSATLDVIVADDGIGIDAATLARLFTPFSQADASTTRRFGGSGLGLAISSMLVRLMGGTITVQSAPGVGSTFAVRLTLATPVDAAAELATEDWTSGLHCRVVGGAPALAQDLAAYIAHAGINVTRSPDLATAAAAEPPSGGSLWLILPGASVPTLSQLRTLAPQRAGSPTRFVVAGWGKRRHARVVAADLVTIDVDSLPRRTLLDALSLASGRTAREPGPQPTRADAEPPRLQARLQDRLILVVEDNETNRAVISRQLALIGFAADFAVNGREALRLWRQGEFALLLTDLHMPQMDGYALAAAIRREEGTGRRTPIVALTANALRDEEQRCRAVGMDGCLIKPVRLAQLKTTIEAWLGPVPTAAPPVRSSVDPTSTDELAPADLEVLKALVGDEPAVIDEVLQAFRKGAALADVALSEGIAAGGGKAVGDAAHKLKAAAFSIGARQLGELCARLENVAEARDAVELNALLAAFQAESAAVLSFLDSR
ncbi:MAG: PAS domain S-box protein [Burkholderiales bacterium]